MPQAVGIKDGKVFDLRAQVQTHLDTGKIELIVDYFSVTPPFHEDYHRQLLEGILAGLGWEVLERRPAEGGGYEYVVRGLEETPVTLKWNRIMPAPVRIEEPTPVPDQDKTPEGRRVTSGGSNE